MCKRQRKVGYRRFHYATIVLGSSDHHGSEKPMGLVGPKHGFVGMGRLLVTHAKPTPMDVGLWVNPWVLGLGLYPWVWPCGFAVS